MTTRVTVGLLYPGELGASLATPLVAGGARVVTTLAGRSARTRRRACEAGVEVLPSLGDVVRASAVVVSLVDPSAADEVARSYAALADIAPEGAVYVDANSIGPESVRRIAATINVAGVDFVDASINGLARNLTTGGTIFLSGPRADEVAQLLGPFVRVRVLGDEIGRASAMKMLLGGLTKGVCGLFLELAIVARNDGILPEMMEACTMIYPGVAALIERMVPTYFRHAGRRATEMREVELTARNAGVDPCVLSAVRELHEQLGAIDFAEQDNASVAALIERIASAGLLRADSAACGFANERARRLKPCCERRIDDEIARPTADAAMSAKPRAEDTKT